MIPSERKVDQCMAVIRPLLKSFAKEQPKLTQAQAEAAINAISSVMAKTKRLDDTQYAAAYESIKHTVGKAPDSQQVVNSYMRLAANWHIIKQGMDIPLWDGEIVDTDLVVLGIARRRPHGRPGDRLVKIKLKTGLCAGIIQWIRLNDNIIEAFLQRHSSLGKFKCNTEEISGMHLKARAQLKGSALMIRGLTSNQYQIGLNRKLCEARSDNKCGRCSSCCACSMTTEHCPLAIWYKED